MTEPFLKLKGLSKHFPVKGGLMGRPVGWVRAVEQVELDVRQGETMGIVGESGCGKSTLARVVLGLLRATEGEVLPGHELTPFPHLEGAPLAEYTARDLHAFRSKVQVVFQDPLGALNPRMLIKDIVAEPLRLHRPRSRDATLMKLPIMGRLVEPLLDPELEPKVLELLEQVGLGEQHLYRFPHQFSGGQRQRITVARALALKPSLLVLDEPTSALDVSVQAQILNLLKELQDELKLTYLLISHDLAVVRHLSDRVAVMYLGRVMELAPTETLYDSPAHPYTEALLSAVPTLDESGRKRIVLAGDVPNPADPPSGCPFHPRCSKAVDHCRRVRPELKPLEGDQEHTVACHVAHDKVEDVENKGPMLRDGTNGPALPYEGVPSPEDEK